MDGRRRLIALIVLAAVVLLPVGAASKKAPASKRLGSVRQKIKQIRYKIHLKQNEKRTVTGQLAIIEDKLDSAQDRLTNNKMKLLDAQTDLALTVQRLAVTKKQLARRQALLKTRIVDIYEGEDLNYIDVVLGSADMWSFLSRAYYLQQILKADTTLISQVRSLKESIERDKVRQSRRVAEIGSIQVELISQRNEVQSNADAKQRQVNVIEHDARLMQRLLDEMEAEENAIEAEIRRSQNTAAGKIRLQRPFHGSFMLPVRGRLTCRFGYRHHPITGQYSFHTGIDLACPTGTSVCAAADGTVTRAGYNRAYGYMVIIEHNGGYSTLYGHNRPGGLLVRVGQEVKQGQVIAKSGSSGYSTGPHVHYQLMKNGTPIRP